MIKGMATHAGETDCLVTLIPRGVTDVYLQVLGGTMSVRVFLMPDEARNIRDWLTEWLDKSEVGPEPAPEP